MGEICRRITQCGHCGRSFSYRYDLANVSEGETDYSLSCPFCQTRQKVPLISKRKVDILRDGQKLDDQELTVPENPVGVPEYEPEGE